jgi:hypothetical protein
MDLCLDPTPFKRNPVHGEFSLGGWHGRRLHRGFRRSKGLNLPGSKPGPQLQWTPPWSMHGSSGRDRLLSLQAIAVRHRVTQSRNEPVVPLKNISKPKFARRNRREGRKIHEHSGLSCKNRL